MNTTVGMKDKPVLNSTVEFLVSWAMVLSVVVKKAVRVIRDIGSHERVYAPARAELWHGFICKVQETCLL